MAEPRRAELKDETDISGSHVVIIEARFYDDIQEALLQGAIKELEAAGVGYDVISVPGALEIPAAIAIAMDASKKIGKPVKPATATIGVVFSTDPDAAKAEGARVDEVTEDGPAARAGLKAGDVITEFDGKEVSTADDVRAILRKKKPENEVEVVVKRGTKTLTLTVTLGKRSDS